MRRMTRLTRRPRRATGVVRVLVRRRSSGSARSGDAADGTAAGAPPSEVERRRVRCRGRAPGPWSRPVISVVGSVDDESMEGVPTAILGVDEAPPSAGGFSARLVLEVALGAFAREVGGAVFLVASVAFDARAGPDRRPAPVLVRFACGPDPLGADPVGLRAAGDPGRLGPLPATGSSDAAVRVARPFVTSGPVSPGRSGTDGSLRDGPLQPPTDVARTQGPATQR